jgi:hypothetical protein
MSKNEAPKRIRARSVSVRAPFLLDSLIPSPLTDRDEDLLRDLHPKTRGDCAEGPRPCPFVSCKHNLFLDVNPETGSIKLNFPDLEPGDMKHSCSLDEADQHGLTLEEVGDRLALTRERTRQIEIRALNRLARQVPRDDV